MSDNQKRVILIQPGPLHLFWTTGVFYFWQLKDRFDFVFIVPSSYLESNEFQRLLALPAIRHVEYLAPSAILWRYQRYQKQFRRALNDFAPTYLLLHNTSYPENQLLIQLARELYPQSTRVHYQNGRMPIMWKEDFLLRRSTQVERLHRRMPWISQLPRVTLAIVNLRNQLSYLLNIKVIPLLAVARVLRPPINVFNGYVNIEATKHHYEGRYDIIFSYLHIEAQVYRAQGVQNVTVIQHPMSRRGDEVFRFLYGDFKVKDQILVVPSYGFTSDLIEKGWDANAVADHVSSRWIEAIESLLDKFPTYKVKLKLHPAAHTDQIWKQIVTQLQIRLGLKLECIQSNVSAEFLVVQSRVIVGDVTSVLWWAALYGNKTVISFDIFGYYGGNELSLYQPYINYVSDLKENISPDPTPSMPVSRELIEYFE